MPAFQDNPYNPNPITKMCIIILLGFTVFHQVNIYFEWGIIFLISFLFYKNGVRLGIKNIESSYVENILKKLDLYELKDCHPMSLSGGQKQRVAIASVLCKNSKLIFFDEPTSGMDYYNMMNISHLINECKSDNKIIFIVSHDQEFLNSTADYVMHL